jgi:hypothetical protein
MSVLMYVLPTVAVFAVLGLVQRQFERVWVTTTPAGGRGR